MAEFYKHIIKRDGKYCIIKNGITYLTHTDLADALHDRDLLVEFDWDLVEVLSQDERPNKYKTIKLPAWDRYITKQRRGDKIYYRIQKTIDGEQKSFGYYNTYDEAVKQRDELEANNWER